MSKRKFTLKEKPFVYLLLLSCLIMMAGFTDNAGTGYTPAQQPKITALADPGDDTDGDGVIDAIDVDDDNDGITDLLESPTGLDPFADDNSNSVLNFEDNLMLGWVDANADGIDDRYDTDRDGIINSYDLDSDGDGIGDVLEAGLADINDDAKVDGTIGINGFSIDVAAMVGFTPRNSDSDPAPNFRDIDSDNDGITDNVEAQFTNQYALPTGIDTDNDGIDNAYDKDNNLLYNHHGLIPVNFLGAVDALPDYIDTDTDDDGRSDFIEGHDADLNGVADFAFTNTDTDGDGLDDAFDLDNTGPNIKNAGMNAIPLFGFDNPPADPPGTLGSRGPLQRSSASDLDRTWRNFSPGALLPLKLVKFTTEKLDGSSIQLNWQSENESNFREFVLERSKDGVNFTAVATIPGKGGLQALYAYVDDLGTQAVTKLYYRLKQVDNNSRFEYSRTLAVSTGKITGITLKMTPNPASKNVTLSIASDKKSTISIHVIDNLGRLFITQRTAIVKGDNIIPLLGANTLQSGIYTVVINTGDEKLSGKLLIQR